MTPNYQPNQVWAQQAKLPIHGPSSQAIILRRLLDVMLCYHTTELLWEFRDEDINVLI
jgi:hypothetical protein